MFHRHRVRFLALLAVLALVLGASWATAGTPQTIVIDGTNDFLLDNRVDQDGGDTEFTQIDLGDVYVTNDAVNLFIGAEHDQETWTTVQIGIAIDVNTPEGGTTDPWGRAIEWSLAPNKPDFMFYVNLDNNWQAGYSWDGADWVGLGSAGVGALGWATGTGFKELAIMLGNLGVGAGDVVNYEVWITQDGALKGPLDAVANDGSQLSTPEFTLWETTVPIPLTELFSHTVLTAADPDPPVVMDVQPTSYPVESFFDVYFNEPVDETTANTPGNYAFGGGSGGAIVVTGATRDAGDPSVVHLTLDRNLTESAELYDVTVTGVQDVAGNPIDADNSACFMLKHVLFRGLFSQIINNEVPPHEFSVEGGQAPLTWNPLCDTGIMVDTGVDDIWEYETIFCVTGDCDLGTAVESFEWKFVYDCVTYESLPSNRVHTLDLANGASDVIEVWWNDEDPSAFTQHDIDVIFHVDMNGADGWTSGAAVNLNGNVLPLTNDVPSITPMADDGLGEDLVAGDGIYTRVVTFPTGSRKDVSYKFMLGDVYECPFHGDRYVFLNDELFDTIGGALGPLDLPVVHYDFCNTLFRDLEVVFQIDFNDTAWENVGPTDVVAVNGTPNNIDPPTFDWSVPSLNPMVDDGTGDDLVAGDKIYTTRVLFPMGSDQNIQFKFLVNDEYECSSQSNRTVSLDPDTYDAVGNPQILPAGKFQICGTLSPVPEAQLTRLNLEQNRPNPFNPATVIRFDVPADGQGSLRVFNLKGELVRTLRAGQFSRGSDSVTWYGDDDSGRRVGSGVYFYRLVVGDESVQKRMMLLK